MIYSPDPFSTYRLDEEKHTIVSQKARGRSECTDPLGDKAAYVTETEFIWHFNDRLMISKDY